MQETEEGEAVVDSVIAVADFFFSALTLTATCPPRSPLRSSSPGRCRRLRSRCRSGEEEEEEEEEELSSPATGLEAPWPLVAAEATLFRRRFLAVSDAESGDPASSLLPAPSSSPLKEANDDEEDDDDDDDDADDADDADDERLSK